MKKWYRTCGWMLLAALMINLGGCAQTSSFLSKATGRDKDDKKLVDVDGKSKKNAKKTDPVKSKSADSQVAKNSTKPKSATGEDNSKDPKSSKDSKSSKELASAKDTAKPKTKSVEKAGDREPRDPFTSDELVALKEASAKKKLEKNDADDTSAVLVGESKPKAKKSSSNSQIQEASHQEDPFAEIADLPDWARSEKNDSVRKSPVTPVAASKSTPPSDSDDNAFVIEAKESNESVAIASEPPKVAAIDRSRPKKEVVTTPASYAEMCPKASGEVLEVLLRLDEQDIEGLKRGIHRIGRFGVEAQPASPAMIQLLKHRDGYVRTHAALALARMQVSPPEAVKTVVEGLKSTDPGIRSFAAAVLAEMGPQAADALATLAESLEDKDGYVRLHAAEVLIRYDRWSEQALETLLAGLRSKDENIRWLATSSLAELAPESTETVDALLVATRDRASKVQIGAVYALGEIGPFAKTAGSELRRLADSTTNQELSTAILYALQQIEQ